jgi:hypothetical protein
MDLEHVNIRNSAGLEDECGVYGIAGVSRLSETTEYLDYEGSGRGSYNEQGHIGILARMYLHSDKLGLTQDEIAGRREAGLGVQYVHELCCRARPQSQMCKLAPSPIILNAGVLQMQLKQIAIFAEQVYFHALRIRVLYNRVVGDIF